ncbi:M20/M25/M40 family metallo-hydrolase [Arthrobacter sp. JCM 19049]|uniref:M20/M25/M40 family metallo-hydrolase n=1 Tax=Arthrobacter sp. JCM 19049 TaxID=1460643 RepID=UPI002795C87D|nr:M20/M25/M40 family metallo-hydrolase [Arthrobacter sp. JCM 19049]
MHRVLRIPFPGQCGPRGADRPDARRGRTPAGRDASGEPGRQGRLQHPGRSSRAGYHPGGRIVELAARWGGEPAQDKVTYGTEAGLFAGAGIPTVVCGPGDIAQAHAPDEFIELSQITACEQFIDAMIADLSQ